jgi:hypothetical protein
MPSGRVSRAASNPLWQTANLTLKAQRRSLPDVVIVTLGLVEVWRDVQADVYLNCTPVPGLFKIQRDRYEFHLTSLRPKLEESENDTRTAVSVRVL